MSGTCVARCLACRAVLEQHATGRKLRYCNDRCRRRRNNQKYKQRHYRGHGRYNNFPNRSLAPGTDPYCANGHRLHEIDFAMDALGVVHEWCTKCSYGG